MACQCLLGSYSSSSLSPNPKPQTLNKNPPKPLAPSSISSHLSITDDNDENDKTQKPNFDFLKLSVTLTVISTALPQIPTGIASVKEKKRVPKKSTLKKSEALSHQELVSWSQGLPVVSNRIPYTQLLILNQEGKLKHVIKPPGVELQKRVEPVLVVLEDNRVLRTVLPSVDSDRRFWEQWEELKIESLCVNAYTPPLKRPEVPSPYLGFVAKWPAFLSSFVKPKKESKRAMELRRAREEFKTQRKEELERMRKERDMIDKAMKAQKKEEERRVKREMRKKKHDESLRQARRNYLEMANVWANLAQDSNVATALGLDRSV
ncbi:putative inactive ATP-dependent zinc metalloprotease FTSHI 2 chloroplastic [Prunus yedoensis var. nudiflora]|uniref:Putative inactive ATP-dependent zinc metalloprotease FTSHI 2 chloroplastic n=1 Tax=Prunus yedoensis var. nudiflora TaxID=2094558 RepID=A0A315AT48_PRUYE|nr:putative inactive ATP-dependent zinc metalloprotease FTSHI 2 chloroplastic [Prunus yedoensis var. nudiflora]